MSDASLPAQRSIVLVGLMGAGKSTVGRRLARRLGLPFVDSDAEIERAADHEIREIFDRFGEASFRDGERRVLRRLIEGEPKVIATGGGAFMDPETRALILDRCTAIWLEAEAETLAERVSRRDHRPLLAGKDPLPLLRDLAESRNPIYAEAHLRVRSGPGPHERTVDRIVEALAERGPRRIPVRLGDRSYEVTLAAGLLDRAGEALAAFARNGRIVAVSDETVWAAQGRRLGGVEIVPVLVPAGEASKSWARLEALVERLLELGVERGDTILAFGGGMVGDLAGFAASILKRGCAYVQAPTSLLAQVDSSVGGKTAINAAAGKNLVGAFHQPAAVLIDPTTLDTLPPRELRSGYAEVVKYGLIGDPDFFAWCESNGPALLDGDESARLHAIETCVRAKAAIVAEDERETSGRRALLNFGHTLGHAVEAEAGILHGEAVAIGMAAAFRRSVELGLCPEEDSRRAIAHLESVGLPTETDVDPERLEARMRHDKKGGARVLTRGIGKAFLRTQ